MMRHSRVAICVTMRSMISVCSVVCSVTIPRHAQWEKEGGLGRPPALLNRPLALAEPGPYLRAAILWNVEFATS